MIGGPQITVTAFSELGATSLHTAGTFRMSRFTGHAITYLGNIKKIHGYGTGNREGYGFDGTAGDGKFLSDFPLLGTGDKLTRPRAFRMRD
jgi:hypothetical protein